MAKRESTGRIKKGLWLILVTGDRLVRIWQINVRF
jgi:hypothetical protein